MQILTGLLLQILFSAVGVLYAYAFGIKNKFGIIGLSYLFGTGIISILFFLLHWFFSFNLDFINLLTSIMLALLIGLSLSILSKRKLSSFSNLIQFNWISTIKKMSNIEHILLLTIIFLFSFSIFENSFWPIIDWDALAFYDFRARVMAQNGNMIEGITLGYFFQYPPYTSFLHVFGYVLNLSRVKIAYSFIYFSLIMSFYSLIRVKQKRVISLLFTLLLASVPMIFEHSIMAYSNLSFTAYYSLGIIYLWLYHKDANLTHLITGTILIGFSNWVRSTEPFWIVGLIIILASVFKYRKHYLLSIISSIWLFLPNQLWRMFLKDLSKQQNTQIMDISSHSTDAVGQFLAINGNPLVYVHRIFEVLIYLISVLSSEFLLIFFLFFVTFTQNSKNKYLQMITILLLFLIIFAGTYIFSFTFETWNQIGGSITRMSMIFFPLLLFSIAGDLKYEN